MGENKIGPLCAAGTGRGQGTDPINALTLRVSPGGTAG
ncbi:Uncharacterised protein [uncultured Clostridium sp.]|uniref:Uncharacterized protein n=1 Tax=Intestinimonas butyriciproducens TaxID=1297617 RepID=A0A2U1CEN7_9FIRM|nr:hypothetical protein C7373_102340 [Intestinimonas butyriciproducens]QBB66137.1 hypothetical protein SRB521_01877 [Intestinimonas butyriciproducens]SCI73937.1 Uncharacterised protein [uncultured Clostridium sp.]